MSDTKVTPDTKTTPMYLDDFSSNGESLSETRALKCQFIKEYGEEKWQELVSRSIRRQHVKRTAQ